MNPLKTIRFLCLATTCFLATSMVYGEPPASLDVLPPSIPEEFSLTPAELPAGYGLIHDPGLLDELGMEKNPGYISLLSEQTAVAERGGMGSFVAVYGVDGVPRMMLNGIYFRDDKHAERFVRQERKKDLRLIAFRKPVDSGAWVLFIACDPKLKYTAIEMQQIATTLQRYTKRLDVELLFNHLTPLD